MLALPSLPQDTAFHGQACILDFLPVLRDIDLSLLLTSPSTVSTYYSLRGGMGRRDPNLVGKSELSLPANTSSFGCGIYYTLFNE